MALLAFEFRHVWHGQRIYKVYTEDPYWKMEGDRGAPKASGGDTEEEDERQGNAKDKQAVDVVKQDIAPSDDKQGVKAGDDLNTNQIGHERISALRSN